MQNTAVSLIHTDHTEDSFKSSAYCKTSLVKLDWVKYMCPARMAEWRITLPPTCFTRKLPACLILCLSSASRQSISKVYLWKINGFDCTNCKTFGDKSKLIRVHVYIVKKKNIEEINWYVVDFVWRI